MLYRAREGPAPGTIDKRHRGSEHARRENYVLLTPPRVKLETDSYRVCVAGREKLPLCMFVNTDQSPAGVRRDPSREPNAPFADR